MTLAGRLGRYHAAGMAGALVCLAASPGWASSPVITVTSISATPALGNVVSSAAGTGNTVFTVTAATGAIGVTSGTGKRLTAGSSLVTVTVTCTVKACGTANIKVANVGTPSNRAGALTKADTTLGRYLNFVRKFPRSHASAAFIR